MAHNDSHRLAKVVQHSERVVLEQIWEGRMGNNQTTAWEVYIDGELVGGHPRKWVAVAIADRILDGSIQRTGDTLMRLERWAYDNDKAMFERLCRAAGQ